jgi:hypothetical protein
MKKFSEGVRIWSRTEERDSGRSIGSSLRAQQEGGRHFSALFHSAALQIEPKA